jgi:hypothetical protein
MTWDGVLSGSAMALSVDVGPVVGYRLRYLDVDGSEREGALPACWGVRFEDVPPVRGFPSYRGQRNFPGLYFAVCMARHVGFESWLERDHLMMLDFSPQVKTFAAQPFWLSWRAAGRVRRHAPDIFVRMTDGRGVVVDVRPDDRIEPEDAEAFEVTAAACESVGWGYRRVGVVDAVRAANVRWLAGYRHARCVREAHRDRLLEVFDCPTPLLSGAETVGDRITVLPSLFHLIWTGALVTDLDSAPLTGAALVRSPGGGVS